MSYDKNKERFGDKFDRKKNSQKRRILRENLEQDALNSNDLDENYQDDDWSLYEDIQ